MLRGIFQGIDYFLRVLEYVLGIYCVLSWFVSPFHALMRFFARIVDPMLRPVRNIVFRFFPRMRIDLSALLMFLVLSFLHNMLWRLYYVLI